LSPLLSSVLGVILDRFLGEPTRWHPLVGFGRFAGALEKRLNRQHLETDELKVRGFISLLMLLVPFMYVAYILSSFGIIGTLIDIALIYLAIGSRSLQEHALRVYEALSDRNLDEARTHIGMLVSRDTSSLDEKQIAKAGVESVLENGCDAIFGALFWFVIAGAPGVVMYRLANTLDAMWGYKNERFLYFGWAAAKLDDILNYIPARLTALTYAFLGNYQNAIYCWRTQGSNWKSPNAGPVMSAGAGALSVQIGGSAIYHGNEEYRPMLGKGHEPEIEDIKRSITLVRRGVWLWLAAFVLFWAISNNA